MDDLRQPLSKWLAGDTILKKIGTKAWDKEDSHV